MDFMAELTRIKNEFFTAVRNAPAYSQYSRLLKRRIPGKNQVRQEFIESLQDLQLLCDDDTVNTLITAQLDKITKLMKW